MSQVLTEVVNSGQPWAAQRAQYALDVHNAVGAGQLSPGEAKEILQEIVNSQSLEEEATNQELRGYLVFGITQLISMY